MPNTIPEGFYVHPDDFSRVEKKVDKCLEAIERLVLIDERQVVQGQRMGQIEQRQASMDTSTLAQVEKLWEAINDVKEKAAEANAKTAAKLDKWINFGLGAWSLAVTAFAVFQALHK